MNKLHNRLNYSLRNTDYVFFAFLVVLLLFGCIIDNLQMLSVLALFAFSVFLFVIRTGDLSIKPIKINGIFFWYGIFFLYVSLSYFWSIHFAAALTNQLTSLGQILVMILCIDWAIGSKQDLHRIMKVYCYATGIFAVWCLITSPPSTYGGLDFGAVTGMQRNATAYVLMFAFFFEIYLWKEFNNSKFKFLAFLSIFVSLLCGSRKIIFGYILALGLWILFQKNAKKILKYLATTLVVIAIILPIAYQIPYVRDTFGERLLAVVDSSIEDSSSNSREMAAKVAQDLFGKHPIRGNGWNSVKYTYGIYYDAYFYNETVLLHAHNNYLEIAANYGLIGVFLYYYKLILAMVTSVFKKNKNSLTILLGICFPVLLMIDWGQVSYCYVYMTVVISILLKAVQFADERKQPFRLI